MTVFAGSSRKINMAMVVRADAARLVCFSGASLRDSIFVGFGLFWAFSVLGMMLYILPDEQKGVFLIGVWGCD